MENVEEVEDLKKRNRKRILRYALIGWLLFATPIVACDTISWGNEFIYSILEPMVWLLAIPGALFGAIVGILLNNKEKKEESTTAKNEETLESKIKGLKSLLDEGLLTQEEFDEQKKKILNIRECSSFGISSASRRLSEAALPFYRHVQVFLKNRTRMFISTFTP